MGGFLKRSLCSAFDEFQWQGNSQPLDRDSVLALSTGFIEPRASTILTSQADHNARFLQVRKDTKWVYSWRSFPTNVKHTHTKVLVFWGLKMRAFGWGGGQNVHFEKVNDTAYASSVPSSCGRPADPTCFSNHHQHTLASTDQAQKLTDEIWTFQSKTWSDEFHEDLEEHVVPFCTAREAQNK